MENITVQSLNTLFSHLANRIDTVMWIRDKTWQKQVYVSPAFEKIWGRSSETLYANPQTFCDYLLKDEAPITIERLGGRYNSHQNNEKTIYYKIVDAQGKIQHIKDTAYKLLDDKNQSVGFIGFSEHQQERQWAHEIESTSQYLPDPQEQIKKHVMGILQNEFSCGNLVRKNEDNIHLMHKNKIVELTARERECLFYLVSGISAKQTADKMKISTRTVEFHLDNVKNKAGCRTKLALLAKVVRN